MKEIISPVDTEDGLFHDGDPSTGTEGTVVSAKWLNPVQTAIIGNQQELASVLKEAGIKIDPSKQDQLLAAIKKITGTATEGFLKVGDFGIGGGSSHKTDAYNNVGEIYRVNATSKNTPTTGVAGVVSLPCDGGPSAAYIAVSNAGAAWVGYSSTPANGVKWNQLYTNLNAYSKSESDARYAYKTITINGKPLSSNISLTASDIGLGNVGNFTAIQQGGGQGMLTNKVYIGWSANKLTAQVDNTPLGELFYKNNPPKPSDMGLGNVGNFMAIQQGGGANQTNSKIYIGWGNDGILRCTVDSTDLGQIYTTKSPPPFPVTSVNGKTGAVSLNDGFSTDGTGLWWDSFSSQLRIQIGVWTIGSAPGSSTTVAFPKAFPNYCIFAVPVPDASAGVGAATEQVGVSGRTNTTVTISKGKGDTDPRGGKYLAIGY
ncbi:hypothetical protein [uncultured Serratia sp.]|uniref:gp53-like domain-containing protein n=1 Tax=uncultured Serratia sp. TaxID=239175 RepID=UPI002590A6BB|nr:hypothetical protein [uncultured Serratia sp.]